MSEGFASHTTLLTAALTVTSGSVLELGAGLGSTPVLHGLCGSKHRDLTTIDSNKYWLGKLILYKRTWHTFKYVESFIDLPEYKRDWGLAFVDHGIIDQRLHSVISLVHVPMIVVHDTCYAQLYKYDEAFSHFKYRYDLKLFGPMTSVISNHIDVYKIFKEFDL